MYILIERILFAAKYYKYIQNKIYLLDSILVSKSYKFWNLHKAHHPKKTADEDGSAWKGVAENAKPIRCPVLKGR